MKTSLRARLLGTTLALLAAAMPATAQPVNPTAPPSLQGGAILPQPALSAAPRRNHGPTSPPPCRRRRAPRTSY
jgi:hypothetical protein